MDDGTPHLSGVVTITNARYRNRVKMRNNNDAEPLICVVPNLSEVPKAELWRLVPSTDDRYQVKNMEFEYTASAPPSARIETHVDGSDREYWWFIEKAEEEKFGPDAYFIRHGELCWHLIDQSHETPIELHHWSPDRRSVWKIIQHVDPDASAHTSDGERLASAAASLPIFPASSLKPLADFKSAIDANVEVHVPTTPIFDIFKCASEMILTHVHRHEELFDLLKSIADIYGELVADKEFLGDCRIAAELVVEKLARQLLECADFITHYSEKLVFWNKLGKDADRETCASVQHFQEILNSFMQDIRRHTFNEKSPTVYRGVLDIDLSGLEYTSAAGVNESKQCLPGSRREVLSEIQDWIHITREDSKKVFWLSGMAGKGKSAIAHTIARWADERGNLGSCFCFDRTRKGDHHSKILSTITIDLAHRSPLARRALARTLNEENELRHTRDLTQQWTKLIIEPLRAMSDATRTPVLIVIDALDESGEEGTRELLLQLFSGKHTISSNPFPPNFRILITARPIPDIYDALHDQQYIKHVSLDDVAPESTGRDVEQYVAVKLGDLRVFQVQDYAMLARKSDGIFEWARLSCEYITKRSSIGPNPRSRYDAVIAGTSTQKNLLDKMYRLILTEAMPIEEHVDALPVFRSVMGQVLALLEPLSRASLTTMRRHISSKDGADVESVIRPLGALLTGISDDQTPIRPLHASFYDFLTDKGRSGEFFVEVSAIHHQSLAFSSLRVMKDELHFNICHLENSYLPNSAVTDLEERIVKYISPELQYACRFWTSHVKSTRFEPYLAAEIEHFLANERILFYLEVLSLTQTLIGTALSSIIPWFQCHDNARASSLIADIDQFVQKFTATILRSTPHLYLSALPSAPTLCLTFQRLIAKFPGAIKIWAGSMKVWPSLQKVIYGHTEEVCSVAISHDGRQIVSGSFDNTIRVWDADTGQQLGPPLRGHTNSVRSIVISHDGRRIVSGSRDKTIRIWDADTGQQLGLPLRGHMSWVTSVVISCDGRWIVSGSADKTIRVWDANTGQQLGLSLEGHTDCVTSVAISHDGRRIVSGSYDNTIRVWTVDTRQQIGLPLKGHTGCVTSVAISRDGRRIVSGSYDKTIRLWNTDTGQQLGKPLESHKHWVTSVAISQDGRRIASGSRDKTILVWDAETRQQLSLPLKGHTGWVASVAISHDGRRTVSGSHDNTIQVWDADTGPQLGKPLEGHLDRITSVVISHDGRRIVSGSDDYTIRIWDVITGQQVGLPLKGHLGWVISVVISHDGRWIVSGSYDKTIRVWDTHTGQQVGLPLEGHTLWVTSVAMSRDGWKIVSGSYDNTIRVWDVGTGQQLGLPLKGHMDCITSVAISHDGRRIVSGSDDKTVRVWDAITGEQLGSPLKGHTESVRSVAISYDGRRIVSGSADKTIRIWDADMGQQLGLPLEGHTESVLSVVISHDGRRIVSGSVDKTIRVWDADVGKQLGLPLEGHTRSIRSIAISHDGRQIVSGSHDKIIRVWNIINPVVTPIDEVVRLCETPIPAEIDDMPPNLTPSAITNLQTPLISRILSYLCSIADWRHKRGPQLIQHTPALGDLDHRRKQLSRRMACTCDFHSSNQTSNIDAAVLCHRPICFSSNPTHALHISSSFWGDSPPSSILPDQEGWVIGPEGQLLLWVPIYYMDLSRTYAPGNGLVIPNDGLQLDLSRFTHGEAWHKCYDPAGV
ncbi:uncharacterized protein FIBRA_02621 [Fibroporia radiculosa]|uniref:Nephrocystin 3-like N-terminal domain-containing protein n=1 Tax=Fibroporia radiculosa TaxID=599839 RepID=J4GN04_9APHY|nr:uncharacterized protein FIBRA_02621 [Fibroporia radiculosa]CCM00585.1 predicted protein [Fibroporia radiculosa]